MSTSTDYTISPLQNMFWLKVDYLSCMSQSAWPKCSTLALCAYKTMPVTMYSSQSSRIKYSRIKMMTNATEIGFCQ